MQMNGTKLTNITSAQYDPDTGTIKVLMPNTSINGYQNTVDLYQTPNTISVPLPEDLAILEVQSPTQMQMNGQQTSVIDPNFTTLPGEFNAIAKNYWYFSTKLSGVQIQQALTSHIENMMMGPSTNLVLVDIMNLLIAIVNYLNSHTHEAGDYVAGSAAVTGNSGTVVTAAPDDNTIISDNNYISANKNLAITGTYQPK